MTGAWFDQPGGCSAEISHYIVKQSKADWAKSGKTHTNAQLKKYFKKTHKYYNS